MGVRAVLADRLEAFARGLWRGPLPLALRARLIAWIMLSAPERAVTRRMCNGVGAGGGAALAENPAAAVALIGALEEMGAHPVLIAGDSHSRLYVQRSRRGAQWLLPLHCLSTGASARGLSRLGSRLGQGEALRSVLAGAERAGARFPVVLVFGQVDVEFVFTFKRLEQDPPADHDPVAFGAFCRETARAYADFAASLPLARLVTLAAIFPPALSDAAWGQGYLNAHIAHQHTTLDVNALRERLGHVGIENLAARTGQHAAFNRALEAAGAARGLGWLDAFEALLDPGGVAGPRRLGTMAGRDHHLDTEAVRPVVTARLWTLLGHA